MVPELSGITWRTILPNHHMIEFSIHGNHESKHGNPLAKARFTRRQIFAGYADRYQEWLEYVRGVFFDALHKGGRISAKQKFDGEHLTFTGKKPIPNLGRKTRMEIFITWGPGQHADPENVFGSIADALFTQDKLLAGSFDFDEQIGTGGRVDVRIWLSPDAEESKRSGSSLHPRPRLKVAKQRDPLLTPKRRKVSSA
jgi:hypothetical protein